MEIGDIVYIRKTKIYGKDIIMCREGIIAGIYPSHILVEFKFSNGNTYKESFRKNQVKKREELCANEYIY